jgi:hypothetical protein
VPKDGLDKSHRLQLLGKFTKLYEQLLLPERTKKVLPLGIVSTPLIVLLPVRIK